MTTTLLHLHNRSTRMTTADPAPASVVFEAPDVCGHPVLWSQVYGNDAVPVACEKGPCVTGVRGRIHGTGTEEPAAYGSPGKRDRDGLPDPSSR